MIGSEENALAKELIDVKIQIKKLLVQEKLLKEQIMPFIKEQGSVNTGQGKVYFSAAKGASTFSRPQVIEYLKEAYGDVLADQIDQQCTKVGNPRQTVYVKLFV